MLSDSLIVSFGLGGGRGGDDLIEFPFCQRKLPPHVGLRDSCMCMRMCMQLLLVGESDGALSLVVSEVRLIILSIVFYFV